MEDEFDREARGRAEKRVDEKLAFFRHFVIYLLVNGALFVFNLLVSPQYLWFLFVVGGWGIGIVAHFVSVFVLGAGAIERWRRKEIEKETERLRRH